MSLSKFAAPRRFSILALTACCLFVAQISAAQGYAIPSFSSTYDLAYRLEGQTPFKVANSQGVTIQLVGTYGPSATLFVNIEEQTCGFFGCNWRGTTVGGTCQRNMYVGRIATCNFLVPISDIDHRLVMTKTNDGQRIRGNVYVS